MPQTRLSAADADFIMKLDEVGYFNSEIGRKLGVTEGAVRYRLKRRASGEPDGRMSKPSNLDVFREWIGAYEESRRRPTLRLLEQMLREHHGYRRSYDALRRYIRKHFPEFQKKGARCRLETPPASSCSSTRRSISGSSSALREPGR